jgi:hypothetical protein
VSALVASPAVQDNVQALQRTLYRAAKADPGRRFHALYDKVHRRDVLWRAWVSPLLCNVYLNRLDRSWKAKGVGRLVRYADDLVVMCATRKEAEYALGLLTDLLGELVPQQPTFAPDRGSTT